MPAGSPRREQLMTAATRVLAEQGSRGFTHRAVDRQAGLPEGSCSAYLRTRQALVLAVADHVTAVLSQDVERVTQAVPSDPDPTTSGELVEGLFSTWLGEPTLFLARLELTLIAARDPEVAARLRQCRRHLMEMASATLMQPGIDSGDRTQTIVAALDGVLMGGLLLPVEERSGYLSRSIGQILTGLTELRSR